MRFQCFPYFSRFGFCLCTITTVKVTPKKGKATNLKATITVKNSTISMKGTDTVTIGATESFAATVKPSAKVSYKSDATEVATVNAKGVVTGVKEGTATITATAKVGTKTVKASKKVEIVNAITAKATATKKIDVTFAGAIEKADKTNFTLTDAKGNNVAIASATLDASKKVVTLAVYAPLTTATDYKVAVKNGEKTYETTFNYVKGSVAKIEVANQVVKAGSQSAIAYKVVDENGLDLTDEVASNISIDATVAPASAANGKFEYNLAKNVVVYATLTYVNPLNGTTVKSEQFSITGVDAVAANIEAVTVSTGAITATAWPKTVVTTVSKTVTTETLYALYTNTYGEKAVVSAGAKSLNPEILIVDATTGKLTPVKAGTASVSVKINDVEKTFTIVVNEDSKATTLAMDTTKSKTTTSLTKDDAGKTTPAKVAFKLQDQYGKDMTGTTYTLEVTSGANVVSANGAKLAVGNKISGTAIGTAVELEPQAVGTVTFKATYDVPTANVAPVYFAVNVTAADENVVGYKFVGVATQYDINGDQADPKTTTDSAVRIYTVNKNGEAVTNPDATGNTVSDVAIKLVNNTTKDSVDLGTTDKTGKVTTKLDVNTNLTVAGTYTLTATKAGKVYDTLTITVADTAAQPVVTVKTPSIESKGAVDQFGDVFDYDTTNYTLSKVTFTSSNTAVVGTQSTGITLTPTTTAGTATLYNVQITLAPKAGKHPAFVVSVSTPITVTVK